MADQEHLALIGQGSVIWNQWRRVHSAIRPDLSGADLSGAHLSDADLNNTNLSGAHLSYANLRSAHLSYADLSGADLSGAGLSGADLSNAALNNAVLRGTFLGGANLRRADLRRANLSYAALNNAVLRGAKLNNAVLRGAFLSNAALNNAVLRGANLRGTLLSNADLSYADLRGTFLSGADLSGADLSGAGLGGADLRRADLNNAVLRRADLGGADFSGATIAYTLFSDVDLREVKGLETLTHMGPSTIGLDTIYKSQGQIPEIFLKEAGVPESFITYMHSLTGSIQPIDYYTCFISYSSKDEEFAKRLYADLQREKVRCWFAPHALRPGTVILRGIDEAIRMYDKLVLILSENSVASNWVEHEVEMALFKEMDKKEQDVLFPIRLDNTVLESPTTWAARLRHRHIADFTCWKHHDDYQAAFTRLLRDLKAEPKKTGEV